MRSLSGASLTMVAVLTMGSFASVGCAKVGEIKAKKAFKSANQAYQAQDYKKAAGFYEKNPGREIPLLQLAGKSPTENSRGLRLGNLVQIRDVIAEDLEGVFAGKSEPKAALDDAAARGNALLRQFQKNIQ